MGLSSALSIAGSGLRTTQTWADVTARNIANAATPGYARKDTQLSSLSGGVDVSAVRREVDVSLERLDRDGIAVTSRWSTISDALQLYTATLGQPRDETSPTTKLTRFQESLNALANKPGDAATQAAVLDAAQRLSESLNANAKTLQDVAQEVDMTIRYDVADVNELTNRLAMLNDRIVRTAPGSLENAELSDEIGRVLDSVAQFMDIRTTTNAAGQVTLYTSGGTTLVDATQATALRYDPGTGGLYAGADDITPATPGIRGFEYGSLAGLYELKHNTLPHYSLQLDELARALVTEFEMADASLTPGSPGIFTDQGAAYTTTQGLAARITVNPGMDPQHGGALWRFRDGAGATTQGASGDMTQALAFVDVFSKPVVFNAGAGLGTALTLETYATAMVTKQHTTQTDAQAELQAASLSSEAFATARQNYAGVNTDDELQRLMLIEQSYAANAKMMTTVSSMMDALLAAV